jgi:hypothetical protein
VTGRQLARVSGLQPAVLAAETALELAPDQRTRVVWRLDGGAGSDEQIGWLLERGYQVIAKGISNRRAEALARQVSRWDPYHDAWLGRVEPPVQFARPVQMWVKRRLKKGQACHSYYLTTLKLPSKGAMMARYDDRGGAEVEQFRNDKSGLHLAARRKRLLPAQMGLVLLTDLAHNLLADFQHRALVGSPFEAFGSKRIVRDLLAIPGRVVFEDAQVKCIDLLGSHPHAQELCICLERYCSGD